MQREESREPTNDSEGFTFADAGQREAEFQELLRKYDGDWQQATDAQARGERPEPTGGSAMP